jgi:hypothetical protein
MAIIGPVADKVAGQVAKLGVISAATPTLNSALGRLIDLAIDGTGPLPGAKQTAARPLERHHDVALAVASIQRLHLGMAAAQGVVTNIGGLVSAIIGTPINVTGLVVVQIRMVAAIAHLHGYDIDDPRVRTALVMCLLGEKEVARQISAGKLPTTPLAVATSPVRDPGLHAQVTERVLGQVLTGAAGKSLLVAIGRKAPVIGGGVGGMADWYDTRLVARCVRAHLVTRRPAGALVDRWSSWPNE